MNQDEIARDAIYQFLKDTAEIYNRIKSYAILIEQRLPDYKAPIHPANELKSLVFHLYNIVAFPTHIETNILEAKEHLCRAFYDVHSIIISLYKDSIEETIKQYKSTTVAVAFPEYGSIIRPQIREIQAQLRNVRTARNTDITLLNSDITKFDEQLQALEKFDDIVESMKTGMSKYEEEKQQEEDRTEAKEIEKRKKDRRWDIIKILITALATALITWFIANKKQGAANTAPSPENQEIQKPASCLSGRNSFQF